MAPVINATCNEVFIFSTSCNKAVYLLYCRLSGSVYMIIIAQMMIKSNFTFALV